MIHRFKSTKPVKVPKHGVPSGDLKSLLALFPRCSKKHVRVSTMLFGVRSTEQTGTEKNCVFAYDHVYRSMAFESTKWHARS